MTVYVADAHAHVQSLVSVVKMTAVLEEYTTEERSCVVLSCVQKDSMQTIFINECFLFTVGSVWRVKRFYLGGKIFADEEVEIEVGKRLRQQPKDFYAAGFDALVKQWDKCTCISVGEYIEKYVFLGSNITCFTFYIHL
jgi:hypothetical protein